MSEGWREAVRAYRRHKARLGAAERPWRFATSLPAPLRHGLVRQQPSAGRQRKRGCHLSSVRAAGASRLRAIESEATDAKDKQRRRRHANRGGRKSRHCFLPILRTHQRLKYRQSGGCDADGARRGARAGRTETTCHRHLRSAGAPVLDK